MNASPKPVCKVPGCERLAYAPRGYCHNCYSKARYEVRKWRDKMAERRWLVSRGLVPIGGVRAN